MNSKAASNLDQKNMFLTAHGNGFNRGAGFSLIEVLVVMGILAMLFGFGLFFSMESYKGYLFRSERNLAISVLQKARSRSLANINQQPHGVHVDTAANKYVLFEGSAYVAGASTNTDIPFVAPSVSHAGMSDVVFSRLDGTISTVPAAWQFSDPTHASAISFNSQGQITWTN